MKKWIQKIFFFLFVVILLSSFYKYFSMHQTLHDDQKIVELVLQDSFQSESVFYKLSQIQIPWKKTIRLLKEEPETTISVSKTLGEPSIYLYNSHPTEEYASSSIGEYMVQPTVIMNNYLLQDLWKQQGYDSYVEEESVKDILNEKRWNYASSYNASRLLLEKRKEQYPSLQYFIDIHRDSLEKDRTTIQIGDKSYAQLLFIVGLENEHYQDNLAFTERIVNKLNEKYPLLCKGIYKKAGAGVNGIYNQDFSPHTILIEVGGYENTTMEVMNSAIAFSQCFLEVLHEETD